MSKVFDPCYASCIHGNMNAIQVLQLDSAENTDLYIRLFTKAIDQGYNPNDLDTQDFVFSQGTLSYDSLLPHDKKRLADAVENAYMLKHLY